MLDALWSLRRHLPVQFSVRGRLLLAQRKRLLSLQRIASDRRAATAGDPLRLENFGVKVFSQGDEDGVIAEIFRRVGVCHRTFIEFGAETGEQNNTRRLLESGWRGLWIEAQSEYARTLLRKFGRQAQHGQLFIIEAGVTAENINGLIRSAGFLSEIDFLSIDIDGNDYHVFEAIDAVTPRVVCLEYNPSMPPPTDWVMPYVPAHRWEMGSSNYGASLVALERLAAKKGYTLVGTALYSVNAFFVRNDLVGDKFSGPFAAERFFRSVCYEDILAFPRTRHL